MPPKTNYFAQTSLFSSVLGPHRVSWEINERMFVFKELNLILFIFRICFMKCCQTDWAVGGSKHKFLISDIRIDLARTIECISTPMNEFYVCRDLKYRVEIRM